MGHNVPARLIGCVTQKNIRLSVVLALVRGVAVVRCHCCCCLATTEGRYGQGQILAPDELLIDNDCGVHRDVGRRRCGWWWLTHPPQRKSSLPSFFHQTVAASPPKPTMSRPFDYAPDRPEHIDQILNGLDRYNPETTAVFQDYVMQQCENQTYDCYANLALLKLYVCLVPRILCKASCNASTI